MRFLPHILGLLVFFCGMVGNPMAGVEPLRVALRADVVVPRAQATLADIADLSGPNADLAATLIIQDLPDTNPRHIQAQQVRGLLSGVASGAALEVRGETTVVRGVAVVAVEFMQDAIIAQLSTTSGTAGSENTSRDTLGKAVVTFRRPPSAVPVPADDTAPWQLIIEPLVNRAVGEIPARVRVVRLGQDIGRTLAVAFVTQQQAVAIPVRNVARGEVLALGDLRSGEVDLASGHWDLSALETLIGAEVRIPLQADAPIPTGAVRMPPAVRGGSQVEMAVTTSGFTLTASATALSDGQVGDTIQVRRLTDGRTMNAQVAGPGQVTISP